MLSKTRRDDEAGDGLTLFRWSTSREQLLADRTIRIPLERIRSRLNITSLSPSGVTVVPGSGNLLIVAARQRALLEVTADGELLAATALPRRKAHRQAEGIAISPAGDLIIADEGGKGRGRLSVYRAVR